LSTSAIESIREHDPVVTDCPNPAHRASGRPPTQLLSRVATLVPAEAASLRLLVRWSAASREFTGQRPRSRCFRPTLPRLLPSRSLATGALPQPDRLGHLLSQARDVAGWRLLHRRTAFSASPCLRACPTNDADATLASQGRLARRSAKSNAFRRTRGAFHRRISPVRGWCPLLHKLSPACGLGGGRLFNLRAAPAVTRLWTRSGTRSRAFVDGL
jgi:hypothetical protein